MGTEVERLWIQLFMLFTVYGGGSCKCINKGVSEGDKARYYIIQKEEF